MGQTITSIISRLIRLRTNRPWPLLNLTHFHCDWYRKQIRACLPFWRTWCHSWFYIGVNSYWKCFIYLFYFYCFFCNAVQIVYRQFGHVIFFFFSSLYCLSFGFYSLFSCFWSCISICVVPDLTPLLFAPHPPTNQPIWIPPIYDSFCHQKVQ